MKWNLLKTSLIAAALALLPLMPGLAAAAPNAEIGAASHDFGTVLEGTDVLHGFVIKNTGDAVLEIKNVRTG